MNDIKKQHKKPVNQYNWKWEEYRFKGTKKYSIFYFGNAYICA